MPSMDRRQQRQRWLRRAVPTAAVGVLAALVWQVYRSVSLDEKVNVADVTAVLLAAVPILAAVIVWSRRTADHGQPSEERLTGPKAKLPELVEAQSLPAPRYFLYVSKTKIDMLYPQVSVETVRSLQAEVLANLGVPRAGIEPGDHPDTTNLYVRTQVVDRYLVRHDKVGTVGAPERYVKDVVTARYGVIHDRGDIAFFGGKVGKTKLALIGASTSMLGEPPRVGSHHSPFHYMTRYLRLAEAGETSLSRDQYLQAYDIAFNALSLTANVEFLGRVLHRTRGLLIVTPIYVVLGDPHRERKAAGSGRPTLLVPTTHPADHAEDAARRAVEDVGISAMPWLSLAPTEQDHARPCPRTRSHP
jgi:uncharacterized protein DUF7019